MKKYVIVEYEHKIFAYIKNDLSPQDRSALEDWVGISNVNQRQFDDVKKLYNLSIDQQITFSPDVDKAWKCVTALTIRKQSTPYSWIYKLVAMAILAIGIIFSGWYYHNLPDMIVVSTQKDEVQKIELDDGSMIWLNENSTLAYPTHFSQDQRLVSFNGQAFFDISKNTDRRPFRIVGEKATVTVLGTSFDLISQMNYSNINVMSGSVSYALSNDLEKKIILTGGVQAELKNKLLRQLTTFNENASSWMSNTFVFRSTPLKEVAQTLSVHFDIEIDMDENIENCLITSSFKDKNLEDILHILEVIAKIASENKEGHIILSGTSC